MRNPEIALAYAYAWIMYGEARLVSAFVRGCAFEMGREFARKRLRLVGDRWITINGTHVETKGGQLMGPVGRKIEGVKTVEAVGAVEADRGAGEAANQAPQQVQPTATVGVREKLGEESYRAVQQVLAGASPGIKSVWGALESKLKVADSDYPDNKPAFTDSSGGMHFNAKRVAKGDPFNAPYATLFHEGGHAIDRLLATAGRPHFSAVYHDGELARTVTQEVRETQERYENMVGDALEEGLKAWIKEEPTPSETVTEQALVAAKRVLMELSGASEYLNEKKDEAIKQAIKQLRHESNAQKFSRILRECKGAIARDVLAKGLERGDLLELASVSDLFDGVSCGEIHGKSKHGAFYWTMKIENGKLEMRSDEEMHELLGTEVFASLFSAHAINGKDLSGLKKWLPKTCAAFDKMMTDIQHTVGETL